MSDFMVFSGMMLPCIVAILLSRFAQSVWAKRLLFWSSAFFLVNFCLMILLAQQCQGSLLLGLIECSPSFLRSFGNALAGYFIFTLIGYVFIGPALLIAAAILEYLKRRDTA